MRWSCLGRAEAGTERSRAARSTRGYPAPSSSGARSDTGCPKSGLSPVSVLWGSVPLLAMVTAGSLITGPRCRDRFWLNLTLPETLVFDSPQQTGRHSDRDRVSPVGHAAQQGGCRSLSFGGEGTEALRSPFRAAPRSWWGGPSLEEAGTPPGARACGAAADESHGAPPPWPFHGQTGTPRPRDRVSFTSAAAEGGEAPHSRPTRPVTPGSLRAADSTSSESQGCRPRVPFPFSAGPLLEGGPRGRGEDAEA